MGSRKGDAEHQFHLPNGSDENPLDGDPSDRYMPDDRPLDDEHDDDDSYRNGGWPSEQFARPLSRGRSSEQSAERGAQESTLDIPAQNRSFSARNASDEFEELYWRTVPGIALHSMDDGVGSSKWRAVDGSYSPTNAPSPSPVYSMFESHLDSSEAVDNTSKVISGNLEEARLFLARRHSLIQHLIKFIRSRGLHLAMNHIVAGKSTDLPSLCLVVLGHGSHRKVSLRNKWGRVAQKLQFDLMRVPDAPWQIKDFYEENLASFEDTRSERAVQEHETSVETMTQPHPNRPRSYSETSEASSLPSTANSIFSPASVSSMSSVMSTLGAGDRLVKLLIENSALRPLCQEAAAKVNLERFDRNLRRLLKVFAVDLRKEAESPWQRAAARFVRSRARNSAHIICRSLNSGEPKHIGPSLPVVDFPQETITEASDNNGSDSDSQECEVADVRDLESFLVTSRAFETLTLNLRRFISPGESKALVAQGTLVAATAVEVQSRIEISAHAPDVSPEGGFVRDVLEPRCENVRKCSSLKDPVTVRESVGAFVQSVVESQIAYMTSYLVIFALWTVLSLIFDVHFFNFAEHVPIENVVGATIFEATPFRHPTKGVNLYPQDGTDWPSRKSHHEGVRELSSFENTH